MQDTMQVLVEERIERRVSANADNFLQETTWQSSINGRALWLRAVIFWETLTSPTIEKHRC